MQGLLIPIVIEGPPIPWTPSRVIRGKFAFNPRYREKEHAQWQVKKQYQDDPISDPVIVEILFEMPIPQATSKKVRALIANGNFPHIKKPDVDNCCKYAIDCVKGIVIKDDNQVFEIHAKKIYGEIPRTVIKIQKV